MKRTFGIQKRAGSKTQKTQYQGKKGLTNKTRKKALQQKSRLGR